MILLVISVLQGVWAYYASDARLTAYMRPVTSKFWHNFTSLLCFVVGMVSLIYGWKYAHLLFTDLLTENGLIAFTIISTVLSLVGAFKSSFIQLKAMGVMSIFSRLSPSSDC